VTKRLAGITPAMSPFDPISPSRVRGIAEELIGPDVADLSSLGGARFAAVESPDITRLLKLEAWKGAVYSFSWGVSLAYIPNKLSLPLRFHRTLKSARFDLWEDSRSVAERAEHKLEPASEFDGEDAARAALSQMWMWALPLAKTWWTQASDLDGVLTLALEQATRQPLVLDALHDPPPQLIAAMTLARLGRLAEAESQLALTRTLLDRHEIVVASEAMLRVATTA
jgi:hypothetical protein